MCALISGPAASGRPPPDRLGARAGWTLAEAGRPARARYHQPRLVGGDRGLRPASQGELAQHAADIARRPRHGTGYARPGARPGAGGGLAGFRDTLHAEWTKLRTAPGTPWLLAAVVLTVSGSAIESFVIKCTTACGADPAKISLTGVLLGPAAIAVLAVTAMTGEYGSGMIRTTLAATPRRRGAR
jgi:hypothetical protein